MHVETREGEHGEIRNLGRYCLGMDVFGSALLDYQSGERDHQISIKRGDGFVDQHSPGLYFAADPQRHEAGVLGRVKGPVLDIGCGAGRHVLHLQQAGVEVAGVDTSDGAIETCHLRGARVSYAGMFWRPVLPQAIALGSSVFRPFCCLATILGSVEPLRVRGTCSGIFTLFSQTAAACW